MSAQLSSFLSNLIIYDNIYFSLKTTKVALALLLTEHRSIHRGKIKKIFSGLVLLQERRKSLYLVLAKY